MEVMLCKLGPFAAATEVQFTEAGQFTEPPQFTGAAPFIEVEQWFDGEQL
jgi:hypothetical protein